MNKKKTLAMKVLEGKKVDHESYAYPESIRDAQEVAAALGMPAGQVFKTLVVSRPQPGKPMLVMIPADRQLDLKKLARAVKEKKLKMASHREAERLTGLQVGGISALALLNRGFDIYLDKTAAAYDWVVVSAGQRGLQIKLAVTDLASVTRSSAVNASRDP
ncbi:MAG: aminoacyl-tRNA deacylase [Anaerolineaceae bacterium]|nr:MAG: aminoacyl-tRNA deacylase [Anaerolineaceae bacterium]